MRITLTGLVLLLLACNARAQLQIEIINGNPSAIPIAVVPFQWDAATPPPAASVDSIISNDLYRSGQFLPLAIEDMVELPADAADIRFGSWQVLKTDYLVIGRIQDSGEGGYQAVYQMVDIHTKEEMFSHRLSIGPGELRYGAHRIADDIYQRLLGIPGAFATRIAYVTATGVGDDLQYEMVVADADGFDPQAIITSPEPLLSPSWAPDGRRLAYVSFEKGNSSIWIQDTFTGSRNAVSAFKGINGAPEFSPDGKHLAVSLSRSGNSEIYIMDIGSNDFRQLTRHYAIDTEPTWSPDGRYIYFTSDRSGRPQIYKIAVSGGEVQRITHQGEYNATASISPDGRYFAVAHGIGNQYRIAILDGKTNRMTVLSDGRLDESPSFAPNGSMILFAAREGGAGFFRRYLRMVMSVSAWF